MKLWLKIIFETGWLILLGASAYFFGLWIVDIVIPTLKGGNFDQLYDLYGIRYLDTTLVLLVLGFLWLSCIVINNIFKKHQASREA